MTPLERGSCRAGCACAARSLGSAQCGSPTSPAFRRWLWLAVALWSSACQAQSPRPVRLSFVVESASHTPIAGARVRVGEQQALSGRDGRVELLVRRAPDTLATVQLVCPEGFSAKHSTRRVVLRQSHSFVPSQGSGIRRPLECTPLTTRRVVVVKTNVAKALPIFVDGQVVGQTEGGVAHLAYEGTPNSSFSVALDTSRYPNLLPRSPARELRTTDRDEISLFEQDFSQVRKRPRRRRKPKPQAIPRPVALR